jgi:hypothetical protein
MAPGSAPADSHRICPACSRSNRAAARFCGACGAPLARAGIPTGVPGRTDHPQALSPPPGFEPCLDCRGLYQSWRHGQDAGPALGAEAITIDLFNAGYDLRDAELKITGLSSTGSKLCSICRQVSELPRGATVRLELPSYELPDEVARLNVSLAGAEWAQPTG